MRCTILTSNNPYFNLATEEYFLKNSEEEHFMLYINEPCIVVGKHQNLLSEINLPYSIENNIKLARRISGGGTVYQDSNNLNFSFIHNCPYLDQISFEKFTAPVLNALKEMGLNVQFSGRHDILIDDKKVSGNAMHVYRKRVLSHGTLLYNADLKQLSNALKTDPIKYVDKSIKSVRSKVTNISGYLPNPKTMEQFSEELFRHIIESQVSTYIGNITTAEADCIQNLSDQKFSSWNWVYGYSPRYTFRNSIKFEEETLNFELIIENGFIKSIIKDPIKESLGYDQAFNLLINSRHDYKEIMELLQKSHFAYNTTSFQVKEFCDSLF